ncbi:hypothetical protein COF65_32145 [Bacillus toyonensis]|uniref:hypothetical protein n=1 Tax=Bacillus cereus group TaxID=86661 RepID=UPI000BF9C4DC|nr:MULTISPECIES: hypothetical protein [Bacillus cereus group]PEQ70062.1 hypothetical protein CN474_17995 [Bacillus thuringiensis]PHD31762.1 hypothetical protein COF65_32145 [Bacillus toyonensis]
MLRLKFVIFLLPLILFVSGCGNTKEETKYEKEFLTQVEAISKAVSKMTKIQKDDQSLSSSQKEYKEALMELKEVIKGFKELVPDSKYEYRQKQLIKSMDEYESSISKLLKGMSDTKGSEWIDGIEQFNKATDMYVDAAGKIVDIRDGKTTDTSEEGVDKLSRQGDTATESETRAEPETTETQPSEQEKDTSIKDTQTQTPEQEVKTEASGTEEESSVEQSQQQLTVDKVKEIIEYYSIGKNDKLSNVSVENGEIKATIALAPNGLFPVKDMAVNGYSQLADELLKHEGWQTLTVTYANVGSVSMNRNEKETNEIGDYFPTLKIEERMK